MLEILTSLFKELSIKQSNDLDLKTQSHAIYLLIVAMQAQFNIVQCLYSQYIIFTPSNNRIIEKEEDIAGKLHKSINYNVTNYEIS